MDVGVGSFSLPAFIGTGSAEEQNAVHGSLYQPLDLVDLVIGGTWAYVVVSSWSYLIWDEVGIIEFRKQDGVWRAAV